MSKLVSALNWVMVVVFVVFAALQYNDPDPYLWIPMYGAAALVCFLRLRQAYHRMLAVAVAFIALVWAVLIVPDVVGKTRFADMFEAWKAMTPESELARELGGLLIAAVWMLLLALTAPKKTRKA